MLRKLVEVAKASGRCVDIVTYYDGPTNTKISPQKARLIFRTPEDAELCAKLLEAVSINE